MSVGCEEIVEFVRGNRNFSLFGCGNSLEVLGSSHRWSLLSLWINLQGFLCLWKCLVQSSIEMPVSSVNVCYLCNRPNEHRIDHSLQGVEGCECTFHLACITPWITQKGILRQVCPVPHCRNRYHYLEEEEECPFFPSETLIKLRLCPIDSTWALHYFLDTAWEAARDLKLESLKSFKPKARTVSDFLDPWTDLLALSPRGAWGAREIHHALGHEFPKKAFTKFLKSCGQRTREKILETWTALNHIQDPHTHFLEPPPAAATNRPPPRKRRRRGQHS